MTATLQVTTESGSVYEIAIAPDQPDRIRRVPAEVSSVLVYDNEWHEATGLDLLELRVGEPLVYFHGKPGDMKVRTTTPVAAIEQVTGDAA